MHIFALLVATSGEGQIEEIAKTFGVDWSHLIAQIISFSIVCILLQRFAYKPVLKMLEQRRQQIAQGQANAEQIKAELARTEERRKEILDQANVQASKLIEEGRAAAARVQEQETQKAIAAAAQIIVKAQEEAVQERTRMLAELKSQFGRLVVETSAIVTGKILTAEDQQRLAEETANQLTS
ncbi:MAG TPA: ATP synthase F0 subunit B [Candidatus Angelobacter sp.]|jgi:F-type H+-transporting ATPase subunit b|nr:ATP synthase F0 subunit B [Candidatus Angelobacter sp.]